MHTWLEGRGRSDRCCTSFRRFLPRVRYTHLMKHVSGLLEGGRGPRAQVLGTVAGPKLQGCASQPSTLIHTDLKYLSHYHTYGFNFVSLSSCHLIPWQTSKDTTPRTPMPEREATPISRDLRRIGSSRNSHAPSIANMIDKFPLASCP